MYTVGVIGGGQLARMMQPAAIALGIKLKVLAEAENSSAQQATTMVGDYNKYEVLEAFSKTVDVITFDHEHVPVAHLERLQQAGVKVNPNPQALVHAQNKLLMRKAMQNLGLPQPPWQEIKSPEDLQEFLSVHDEAVVKTPIGGYDGKGVRVVTAVQEVSDWLSNLEGFGGSLLVEQKISFTRELSQLSARSPSGEFAHWPLVQTVQRNGVCSEVIAPAPQPSKAKDAEEIARAVATGLNVTGVLAVELFEDQAGNLLINELAMRPHNSGHFTIEGSITSQFEQHLRAVLNLPLGDTSMKQVSAVMLNLLGVDDRNTFVEHYPRAMELFPEVKFHSYEKGARLGRKMGHITLIGSDWRSLLERGNAARDILYGKGQ